MSTKTHSSRIETIKENILSSAKISDGNQMDIHRQLDDLVEETRRESALAQRKIYSNPAIIGLAGFALSTILLQFHNLGWMGLYPVLCVGGVLGGVIQMTAGLMEFATGNNFGFCAFTTYGGFWISLVLLSLNKHFSEQVTENDKALFLIVFLIFSFIMFVASTRQHAVLMGVFFTLNVGLLLLVFSHFYPRNSALKTAGASFLLLSAFGALYIMSHLIYFDAFKYNVLPVGLPVQEWRLARDRGQQMA